MQLQRYYVLEFYRIISPKKASVETLSSFHSKAYVDYLQKLNNADEGEYEKYEQDLQEYGLGTRSNV